MRKVQFKDGSKYYVYKGVRVDYENGKYYIDDGNFTSMQCYRMATATGGGNVCYTQKEAKEVINYILN